MKKINGYILATFLTLFLFTTVFSQQTIKEEDVRDSFEKFNEAFQIADVSTLNRLLSKNYIHINGSSGSLVQRNDWLKWIESRRELLDKGELLISTYRIEDLKIQIFGQSAIVTGIVESSGERNGEPFKIHVRFTNVWVVEDGLLRRAAFHDSAIPDDKY